VWSETGLEFSELVTLIQDLAETDGSMCTFQKTAYNRQDNIRNIRVQKYSSVVMFSSARMHWCSLHGGFVRGLRWIVPFFRKGKLTCLWQGWRGGHSTVDAQGCVPRDDVR